MMASLLPDVLWRQRPGIIAVCDALGPGNARFVGGAVRDTLLDLPVSDVDVATPLLPRDVIDRLEVAGIKAVPTGIAHGTVTAFASGDVVEVTTLRRDVATDGRHATVDFTDEWRDDAARRDFTINALYADPWDDTISDWFGGLSDLAARRVRFIGDPLQRIAEDHLRILRFFRFLARFGDEADPDGLAACTARANDLMALSRERIAAELLKLLVAPRAVETLALMVAHGIFAPVLPEIDATGTERLARLAAREVEASIAPHPLRRLAALIPADPATAESIGARLKLSTVDRRRLESGAKPAGDAHAKALAYRLGPELAVDRLLLSGRQPSDAKEIADWTPPRLPISGGALVDRGLAKGPEVAAALRAIEDQWLAEGFPAASRVAQIADAVVAQRLAASR